MTKMKLILRALCVLVLGFALAWTKAEAATEGLLAHGAYLMGGIVACGNCHTTLGPNGPVPGMELAGGLKFEEQGFVAYAPNITPDRSTGIGGWTDGQIITAMRDGLRPDGSLIGPPMPIGLYRGISDRDAAAIVAYLRSVPPVRNAVPKSVYNIALPPAYGPPVTSVAEVPRDDPLKYGAYLAGPLGHCIECHTPFDGHVRDYAKRLGAGGFALVGPWGETIAANITPDRETGLGAWSARRSRLRSPRPFGLTEPGSPRPWASPITPTSGAPTSTRSSPISGP